MSKINTQSFASQSKIKDKFNFLNSFKKYWKINSSNLSLTILMTLFFSFGISLIFIKQNLVNEFENIKQATITELNYPQADKWNFDLGYFFKQSGVALSLQATLTRQSFGFGNDASHAQTILDFFSQNAGSSALNSESISGLNLDSFESYVQYFYQFNTQLQLFIFFVILTIIFGLASLFYFLIKSFILWSRYDGYSYLTLNIVLILNFLAIPVNFVYYYLAIVKNNKKYVLSEEWFKKQEQRYPLYIFTKIKSYFVQFKNLKNLDAPLLVVENLKYSYNHRHHHLKHIKDVFNWIFKSKNYHEKDHIFETKSKLNQKFNLFAFTKNKHLNVINDISCQINKGSFTTILGPNGCGKSTFVKLLVGIETKFFGSILWNGQSARKISRKSFAQNVTYIPQILELPSKIKVYDFVGFSRLPYSRVLADFSEQDHEAVISALKEVKILHLASKYMDELSGGQKQKALIAMILAQKSNTIILDEPTTYLDIKNQAELLKILKILNKQGKTIITILHEINQAIAYSTDIIVLEKGKVYSAGKPEEVINQKMLKEVFKIDAHLEDLEGKKYLTQIKGIQ